MKNNQLKTKTTRSQISIKKWIYNPQLTFNKNLLTNFPQFRANNINKKLMIPARKTNLIFMTTIIILRHTYDRYIFHPQPRKDYRLFLGEKIYFPFLKILLKVIDSNLNKKTLKRNSKEIVIETKMEIYSIKKILQD